MIKRISIASLFTILVPAITFAADKDLAYLIAVFIKYLNQALFVLIGVAVVVFIYHIVKYFILPNEDRKAAGNYVMYSVIGFFVIISFWGLVNIIKNTFELDNQAPTTWGSFSNLFPSGGSTGGSNNNGSNSGSQTPFSPSVVPVTNGENN